MNYKKIYDALMERAEGREITGYHEMHHKQPRCMGGSDSKDNLVKLTAREHFTAHLLLVKIFPKERKLIYAANMMSVGNGRSNRRYEWLKIKRAAIVSEQNKGKILPRGKRMWITNGIETSCVSTNSLIPEGWRRGRTPSPKQKTFYDNRKGSKLSDETKDKISKAKMGYKHSIETRQKIARSRIK